MRSTARLTDAVRGRKTAVSIAAAAAVLGAGTATAATGVLAPAHHPVQHAVAQAAPAAARPASASSAPASPAPAGAVARQSSPRPAAAAAARAESWSQIQRHVASQTAASEPRAAGQLQPVGPVGTQAWMPINGSQLANAATIVKQALDRKMGLRSAVIAVATAMQEAKLQNIGYGTSDSLGLFQQRPSCGWGSPHQIMQPKYAADAFLRALQQYQAGNPAWARQPLWRSAQGVQGSAFPFAYAKWETQAIHLVKHIVSQVK